MTIRRVLLSAYPRSWRAEYGEELDGLLAQRRLTPRVVADVLWNAAKHHLHEPWKTCGAVLCAFTLLRLLVWTDVPTVLFGPVLILLGAWTAMRGKSGISEVASACAKAAILCCLADLLTVVIRGPLAIHANGAVLYRWGLFVGTGSRGHWWQYVGLLPFMVVLGVFNGFAGALMAKFFAGIRERLRT